MLNTSSLTKPLGSVEPIRIGREIFPPPVATAFRSLFEAHGMEVRGEPFSLNYKQYHQLEFEGRLVWIVARVGSGVDVGMPIGYMPIGYSCSWWYRDMHFDERCAAEDLWYVCPEYRRRGIGRRLKEAGHEILEKAGVTRIGDNIRDGGVTTDQMAELGFEPWGTRWLKIIPSSSGN
jgi:GNAT superfamily N-acetyltransferase